MRNLRARGTWYKDALILCQSTGALKT
jgi:hypothetical protein